MKKEVFIVHGSEIVRRGLHAILRNYFSFDMTLLPDLKSLNSFSHIEGAVIILIAGLDDGQDLRMVERLRKANQVHLVQLVSETNTSVEGTGGRIGISAPAEDIRKLVSGLIASDPPREDRVGTGDLSARERDVLQLVALGHSNKEIADKLFISIHTVISHRKNITDKLGIKSISGLTVYAILNRIVDTDHINIENLI